MNPKSCILGALALLFMGTGAGFLRHQQSIQRLGVPGVKVVAKDLYDEEGHLAGTNSVPLPDTLQGLPGRDLPIQKVVLDMLPKDTTYAQRFYHDTNRFGMQVSVVLMGADRTSIHKPEFCLKGGGWGDHRSELATIPIAQPHPYELPVMRITTSRQQLLPSGETAPLRGIYVYWFVADRELTARHVERMWWMARDMLTTGVLQRWAYVSAFSICFPGEEEATFERMKSLIATMVPHFQLTAGRAMQLAGTEGALETREAGRP